MPKLYLVPNSITEQGPNFLPNDIGHRIKEVRVFFMEEPKSGRQLLKSLDPPFPLNEARFLDLNEHTTPREIQDYVNLLKENDCAIISEAGCPCVADPGAELVLLAHHHQIEIIPLIGPSSIILSLMASGLNGQNFAFNGYLPKEKQERVKKIKSLEERSLKEKQTQIFMEAPYRNQNILEDILTSCRANTLLCIACNVTAPDQMIKTMSIKEWKNTPLNISKKPALFLLSAAS